MLSAHADELVVIQESRRSEGQKSDKRDAFALADGLRLGKYPRRVFKAPRQFSRLRALAHSMRAHQPLAREAGTMECAGPASESPVFPAQIAVCGAAEPPCGGEGLQGMYRGRRTEASQAYLAVRTRMLKSPGSGPARGADRMAPSVSTVMVEDPPVRSSTVQSDGFEELSRFRPLVSSK